MGEKLEEKGNMIKECYIKAIVNYHFAFNMSGKNYKHLKQVIKI
jgi:hypothetical protein